MSPKFQTHQVAFPPELAGRRLDQALAQLLPQYSRTRIQRWIDDGAVRVNGLDALAITKMDVLDGFETLKVCTAYKVDGETLQHFPSEIGQLARCEPVYQEVPGWSAPTAGVKRFEDLPAEARAYIATLEDVCGVPVGLISTGSDRLDTILRADTVAAQWFTLPA